MDVRKQLEKGLEELRKTKERKFDQSVDLIINLQKFDVKKSQINLFIQLPFKVKDKKICGFLETKQQGVDTITPEQFKAFSSKLEMKKLVKKYDFFIAQSSVMPRVASTFGRVLGPTGKMPSPQLGILIDINEKSLGELKKKINNSVRVRVKEASVKLAIGKQSMPNKEIIENILAIYNPILKSLPKGIDNVKNLEIKFTMTKPVKIQVK